MVLRRVAAGFSTNLHAVIFLTAFVHLWNASSCISQIEGKKTNIRDYTDAEIERLYDEWEENDDDKLPDDELPVWKRKPVNQPGFDLNKLKDMQPEDILKATKKGKNVMMFVTVANTANPADLEQTTELWQDALRQMHINAQRFIVGENRVVFMFEDGSYAWPARDFLLAQERCEEVNLEGKSYPGNLMGRPRAVRPNQEL